MKIKEIQALRALAAGLVLLFHAKVLPGGFIGVDIFYVISGYLITGLIIKECDRTGRLDFASFYARRAKRLLPTSFFVLAITALSAWAIFPPTMRQELGKHIAGAALYLSNFLFALWGNDYQNLNATPPVVIHYWSLAVEEQFYLFWPIFIFAIYRRGGRRLLGKAIAVVTGASFLFSLYLTATSPVWAFYILPTRAWELGIGALLLFMPSRFFRSQVITGAAFLALGFSLYSFNEETPFPGTAALFPVLATAFLIGGISHWPRPIEWIGNLRISQWLGEISYPLYLWHWPVLVLPAIFLGRSLLWQERALCLVVTIVLADVTHRIIEEPLRHRDFSRPFVLRSTIAVTGICVVMGMAIYATYSEFINIKGTNLVFRISSIMAKPSVYSDGCHSGYTKSVPALCEYGDLASKKVVVLYGDSHAAQWFPALERIAREEKVKLVNFTKSACPAAEVARADHGGSRSANCTTWRKLTLERISQMKPDAVIVSGFQYYKLPRGFETKQEWLLEGQVKLADKLEPLTQRLIYIADTPLPERDIPSCLALRSPDKCLATPSEVIVEPRFSIIDPTPWLCSRTCPGIKNEKVAYRDDSHISVAQSIRLKSQLEQELVRLGVL